MVGAVTALSDACADAARWLPEAAVLTAEPDTGATMRGGKPGSRPPWNSQAANSLWDALAVIADTEAMFRLIVTGHTGRRRPASATGAGLAAIERLGHAVPPDRVRTAARELTRCVQAIMVLPALDEVERPQRIPGVACPYCKITMMMTLPKAGIVYCKLGGSACWDTNGNPPRGRATVGRLGPCVEWEDSLVT